MKISCNVKQGTSLVKNSSQTVEIKDKTNEKSHTLISTVCKLFFTKEVPCFTLQDVFISGEVLVLAFWYYSLLKKCLVSHCKFFFISGEILV